MDRFLIFLENFITIVSSILGTIMVWIFAIHIWIEIGWIYGILLCLFAMVVTAYFLYINICNMIFRKYQM